MSWTRPDEAWFRHGDGLPRRALVLGLARSGRAAAYLAVAGALALFGVIHSPLASGPILPPAEVIARIPTPANRSSLRSWPSRSSSPCATGGTPSSRR